MILLSNFISKGSFKFLYLQILLHYTLYPLRMFNELTNHVEKKSFVYAANNFWWVYESSFDGFENICLLMFISLTRHPHLETWLCPRVFQLSLLKRVLLNIWEETTFIASHLETMIDSLDLNGAINNFLKSPSPNVLTCFFNIKSS